jgi:hypothetical protein
MKTKTVKASPQTASTSAVKQCQALITAEENRLAESANRTNHWQRWGPYLSERQWGTVREDYSENGDCWNYFSHDQARSRAYRWGEDGLLGICDRQCRLCFSVALWNGRDPILKERLFGLTGPEGNHGEDVKECYYYLDATPTHSYLKALYKYPQAEYPYARLIQENQRRGKLDEEFELPDTGVFDGNRYFDVFAEYAKNSSDDILIRLTVANRGPETARVHLLPTLWFRNTWSWGCTHEGCETKPRLERVANGDSNEAYATIRATHSTLGEYRLMIESESTGKIPELLFTENETNTERLFEHENTSPFVKDAVHRYLIHGTQHAVNPQGVGTKVAACFQLDIPAGQSAVVRLRLVANHQSVSEPFGQQFDSIFEARIREADEFYEQKVFRNRKLDKEEKNVARQAYAGLIWSKQFYHVVVKNWLEGDADQPPPPATRRRGRNHDWPHLYNRDIISMPDKWEYPWYAAWDLAFHMIPMARLDAEFAKGQLELLLREWYMHPNGQIPAYEFAFSDVNPPVHAWACWRVYKITGQRGHRDREFLARVFTKLMLNFTWWVNRKDVNGQHLFSGGFLGLDNIGVFDRSKPLPGGGHLEQADGTAWMAFYCATMLAMALELAMHDSTYEDIASKFFEHFVHIADAMNTLGGNGLWNENDGFYYDQLHAGDRTRALPIRSIVGVIPLFAVEILEQSAVDKLPGFKKRMDWFLKHRPDLARMISWCTGHGHAADAHHQHWGHAETNGENSSSMPTDAGSPTKQPNHGHRLLAIPSRSRLERVLRYVLDEAEFLSPYGVRALSRHHHYNPFVMEAGGEIHRVDYVPGESTSGLFGGNSNWRGPVWFPVNFLLVESLERYHHFFGDDFTVEFPHGSGNRINLKQAAKEIAGRLARIFLPDDSGRRACHASDWRYAQDEHWRELVLFHEYFHGDSGRGVGASHQTGWTALVTELLGE